MWPQTFCIIFVLDTFSNTTLILPWWKCYLPLLCSRIYWYLSYHNICGIMTSLLDLSLLGISHSSLNLHLAWYFAKNRYSIHFHWNEKKNKIAFSFIDLCYSFSSLFHLFLLRHLWFLSFYFKFSSFFFLQLLCVWR